VAPLVVFTGRVSANTGWRNASFRSSADYMQTSTFRENLDREALGH
jgi:hypothetical protein